MYTFYPRKDDACPNAKHCPHAGGVPIAVLVLQANENELSRRWLHGTIETERERNDRLFAENQRLQTELERVKLELKLERQNKFAMNSKPEDGSKQEDRETEQGPEKASAKRGAPVGHPGWFRPTPQEYDWEIEVDAPRKCPCCGGSVTVLDADPQEHFQEDIIDGQYRVVLYRHAAAKCVDCDRLAQKAGPAEILNSRIGPGLRSKALYLRHVIGISYRNVPRAIEEMFGISFTPAALLGFEIALAGLAEPIVEDIAKKISSSDGAVHADETYWTLNGERAYFWVHGDEKFIHFTFDTTRAGQVSRNILGPDFCGTLVTDCYSGYNAQVAGAKQKCLAHLSRTARDWQKLTEQGSIDHQFFADIQEFVKRGCRFARRRKEQKLKPDKLRSEIEWLRSDLERLSLTDVKDENAIKLQGRLLRHLSEWLVFIDDPRVSPTNNLAERAIRPLVVLRKLTFGSRSLEGGQRMAALMSVAATARRHGHRASDIFYELYTRPPDKVLRGLYAGA